MLRLISIVGIAIAMLIGFIAISSKMKEDYTVRSRVVSVLQQMKNLATDELQCGLNNDADDNSQSGRDSSDTTSAVEMSAELDTTPLIENSASTDRDSTEPSQSSQSTDPQFTEPSESTVPTQKTEMTSDAKVEDADVDKNADIIRTMGYRVLDPGNVEVIVVFNNINGESGKTRVKSGSRVTIQCSCPTGKLACDTVESNINKNYLPKHLTRQ